MIWSSWTTDIDTAIYFAKVSMPRKETPYLLITQYKEDITVKSAIEFAKHVHAFNNNSLARCSSNENEVILNGPIQDIYIMEIPDNYSIN